MQTLTRHTAASFVGAFNDNIFRIAFGTMLTAEGASTGTGTVALMAMAFMAPFLVLAPTTGALGDRWPRDKMVRLVRVLELGLIVLGTLALWSGSVPLMLLTMGCLGAQSALFGPVKYAIIPQLVADRRLPSATGTIQAATGLAILGGTAAAGLVDPAIWTSVLAFAGDVVWVSIPSPALVVLAIAMPLSLWAWWLARGLPRLAAADPNRPIPGPWAIRPLLAPLGATPGIWGPVWGLAAFWALGAVVNVVTLALAQRYLGLGALGAAGMSVAMAVGIAAGSFLAPRMWMPSRPHALVAVGAFVAGVCALGLGLAAEFGSVAWSALAAFGAGVGGGMWQVPLNVAVQRRAPSERRSAVFAGLGWITNCGLVAGFGLAAIGAPKLGDALFVSLIGGVVACGALVALWRWRWAVVQWLGSLLVRCRYRIDLLAEDDVLSVENGEKGRLIIANHQSFVDGILFFIALPCPIRFIIHRQYVENRWYGWLLRGIGAIPIDGAGSRRALVAAIRAATEACQRGETVMIFPEGSLTRSGAIAPVGSGATKIAEAADVPIVPVGLDGLLSSRWSKVPGPRSWKRFLCRRRVAMTIGTALSDTSSATIQESLQRQHANSFRRLLPNKSLGQAAVAMARQAPRSGLVTDQGGSLNRLQATAAAVALPLPPDLGAHAVGVLLPPGRGGTVVSIALALRGIPAVHLNHTVGPENLSVMCAKAGITTVISSPLYLRKAKISLPDSVVMVAVEDLFSQLRGVFGTLRRLWSVFRVLLQPGLGSVDPDTVAAIVFSSGSTGQPKGVQLTHRGILANIAMSMQHLRLSQQLPNNLAPVLLNSLPLFHSFGLTVGCWLPVTRPLAMAAHADPRDARGIGEAAEAFKATFLVTTPTFARSYVRRISAEQFSTMQFLIVGAEKCSDDLRQAIADRFAIPVYEGYGATELGPVAACNFADIDDGIVREQHQLAGSVGRLLPGIEARVVDPDTGRQVPAGADGLLLLRSPAQMLNYLDEPEKTASVVRDGFYETGDMARIDRNGFLTLTGRMSRFAKIGGEMVPLDLVQERLVEACVRLTHDSDGAQDGLPLAVAAVPDSAKGERLVVLSVTPCDSDEIINAVDLPPLFTPKAKDWYRVDEIPLLGTGKLDLAGLSRMARELAGG